MPVSPIPSTLVQSRQASLAAHLPAALGGGVRAVHQARVASRRLREALPVFGPAAGPRLLSRALKHVRRVTQALGPVREMDVTLELLTRVGAADAAVISGVRRVTALVQAERGRRRAALLGALDASEVKKAIHAVDNLVASLLHDEDRGEWRTVLAERATTRAERLIEAIYDVGLLFDPARLHEVRIAAKKLRYSLELVTETKLGRAGRFVSTLKRGQELLGELHDLEVALIFVRAAEVDAGPRVRRSLALLRTTLERACHREHARYLARRGRLLGVCEAVPRLLAPVMTASRVHRPASSRRGSGT